MRAGNVDLSWIGWQWAVSVASLVDRPPTGRGLAGGGRMGFKGACCWEVGQLEGERKRSNHAVGGVSGWGARHLGQ